MHCNFLSLDLAEVSLDLVDAGVVEGGAASFCLNITNSSLLSSANPPTVRVTTEFVENGGIMCCIV